MLTENSDFYVNNFQVSSEIILYLFKKSFIQRSLLGITLITRMEIFDVNLHKFYLQNKTKHIKFTRELIFVLDNFLLCT